VWRLSVSVLHNIDLTSLAICRSAKITICFSSFGKLCNRIKMVSLIRTTQVLLALTLGVGLYTTWYLLYKNGTVELMQDVRDRGPHILPGTRDPLKKSYIGIGWIDYQLTVLTLFFWEAVDGSRPAASLFCFGFAGQATAAWSILYVEGRRLGNRWRLVSL